MMFDCAKDVLAFHDEKVTLPQAERDDMRDRRDKNRTRLENGLKKNEKPARERQASAISSTIARNSASEP